MHALQNSPICWSVTTFGSWRIHLAATSKGLCYVGSPGRELEELEAWAAKRFPGRPLVHDAEKLRLYEEALGEYEQGARRQLTFPVDLQGTAFQRKVWDALTQIPYGQTCTYADIARRIGKPTAARAVGAAIGANPVMIAVPCHRVIGASGALTGFRGGLEMKQMLLKLEGGLQDEADRSLTDQESCKVL